jgi:AraC family transcriptional regulator of adaptative response / DNA-3-methyladenine glycosylase II
VRLAPRGPYDWEAMLGWLAARAVEGVEQVEGGAYRRDGVTVRFLAGEGTLVVEGAPALLPRVRRLLDVDADVLTIGAHLSRDPLLAPLVAARPGLRVPGAWDPFELAVRAVLGQQVTVVAARRLAGQLVRACGTTGFPGAGDVLRSDLSALPMPRARRDALRGIAEAALHDPDLFRPLSTLEETVARLRRLRGVGEWTAQYVALRALREADAFPAGDVGLQRSATVPGEARPTAASLLARAERWRPYRAYAAQHLWAATVDARVWD